MNKKLLYTIIGLLAIGSMIPILASNTIVGDTSVSTSTVNTVDEVASNSISTKDLTVTGTCTGCGSGGSSEGSFTTWTMITNTTSTALANEQFVCSVQNNGNFLATHFFPNGQFFDKNGNTLDSFTNGDNSFGDCSDLRSSLSSEHTYLVEMKTTTNSIVIYKNATLIQTIPLNMSTDWQSMNNLNDAISPDGKYIVVTGNDVSSSSNRIQVYEGS